MVETTTDTHQATLLEAAIETCRLQLLARRDQELLAVVLAAFPSMTEAEAIEALQLAGGL